MSKKGEYIKKLAEKMGHELVKTPWPGLEVCRRCLLRRQFCKTKACTGTVPYLMKTGKRMWNEILADKNMGKFLKKEGFDVPLIGMKAKYSTHPLAISDRRRAARKAVNHRKNQAPTAPTGGKRDTRGKRTKS